MEQTPALIDWRIFYIPRSWRFALSIFLALCWALFSLYFSLPWIEDLAKTTGWPVAIYAVMGIAIIPGYMNAFLLAGIFLDRPRPLPEPGRWPSLTAVVAAYNEEDSIGETVKGIVDSDYPGKTRVIVVDDGSDDLTYFRAARAGAEVIYQKHSGKAEALNQGLVATSTDLLVAIDADTLLTPEALRRAVCRLMSRKKAAAVAGAVMVRNSRQNWLSRLQEWDYQMGIGSIKRVQGLWGATLVAQGSFSLFHTKDLRLSGGWEEKSGEDIVLSWSILARGREIIFEPTALAWTRVPSSLRSFSRQRVRWARGMIEGIEDHGWDVIKAGGRAWHGALINMIFPWVDIAYVIFFLPGLVLAAGGNFMLAGPWTLFLLPLVFMLSAVMYLAQRKVFRSEGYTIRHNKRGYLFYIVFYQPIVSLLALFGYVKEITRYRRDW